MLAAIGMLESLLDPVSRDRERSHRHEPESEDERKAVAKSKAGFKQRGGQ
jgi:hypothetical protein